MRKQGVSQETLKLVACATMLLDHIGAALVVPTEVIYYANLELYTAMAWGNLILRCIGRIAFPIFCFLLVEGVYHTRNPKKYLLRLAIGMILSEVPFDLAFFRDGISWEHQSVMVTLLLGFAMLRMMEKCRGWLPKLLLILPFAWLAEWSNGDYGAEGVCVIALFALTRQLPHRAIWQFFGLWCIFSPDHRMILNWLEAFSVSVQEWAVLAVLPIALYDGRKMTKSKTVQWAFYLFYPAHLLILYLVGRF